MKNNHAANGIAPKHVVVKGKRMVLLDEAEFNRLRVKADEWEPEMPEQDANGNYPAVEALQVSLARKIIRRRRRLGITQPELARRAGIRLGTLKRIEQALVIPSVRMVEKIDRALDEVKAKAGNAKASN